MADGIFFSARRMAFFNRQIHGDAIPDDAVAITARQHAALLEGQAAGGTIIAGSDGAPRLDVVRRSVADRRAEISAALGWQAGQRIRAVAGIEQQSNDNALIAQAALQIASQGGTVLDITPALARRDAIDALRARCKALQAQAMKLPAAEIEHFDPHADALWSNY